MKKNRYKIKDMFMDAYKETKRSSLLVFLVLRFLVIACMILQIIHGNFENALLCIMSLVLLLLPSFIEHKLDITLPNTLEIIIYLFIFAAEILGEINNFYGMIPYWDTILHTLNGFLCAAVGFSLVNLLDKTSSKINLSPLYLCIVAFCFSMTIGVLWEFFEYGSDKLFKLDMQKDSIVSWISTVELNQSNENKAIIVENIDKTVMYNKNGHELAVINGGYLDIGINDTMKDLLVNFIGALTFCFFGFFYLKYSKHDKFIKNFVPTKGRREVPASIKKKIEEQEKLKKK